MKVTFGTLPIKDEFVAFHTHPCKNDPTAIPGDTEVIECSIEEAQFHGVYVRRADNPVEIEWVADCDTEADAYALIDVLISIAKKLKP